MCLNRPTPAGRAAVLREFLRDRLDYIENGCHVFFIVRENDARGESVRDEQGMFARQRFHDNKSRRRDLFVFIRRDLDLHQLFFANFQRADNPTIQSADDLFLFQWGHADKDRNAIAEQRDEPFSPARNASGTVDRTSLRSSPMVSMRSPSNSARTVMRRSGVDGKSLMIFTT